MKGYGITIIPGSWALGFWKKDHKSLLSIGPIRLVKYLNLGGWKA